MTRIMKRMVFALLYTALNLASDTEKKKSSWNKEIDLAMSGNYMYLGLSIHPWLYHLPDYSEKSEKIREKREEGDVITKEIFLKEDIFLKKIEKAMEPICKFCRGKILPNQLLVAKPINGVSYHALCTTGYRGLDSVDFLKKRSKFGEKYGRFYAAIVSIFETTESFINLGGPIIITELQHQGFYTDKINTKESMWRIIRNLPHIVWWREYTPSGNFMWAIHRKHYGKSDDVDWKSYIVEIMNARREELTTSKLALITPTSLLQFILWKTNSSFDEALSMIEDFQFFWDDSEKLCVRLKNGIDRNNAIAYFRKPLYHCGIPLQLSEDEENQEIYSTNLQKNYLGSVSDARKLFQHKMKNFFIEKV